MTGVEAVMATSGSASAVASLLWLWSLLLSSDEGMNNRFSVILVDG